MPIENILKILEEEFERMMKIFDTKDWKFYKFGQGGPYKRTLSLLKKQADEYDKIIFERFGTSEETPSFMRLIVLCISNTGDSYEKLWAFKKQIQFMRRTV